MDRDRVDDNTLKRSSTASASVVSLERSHIESESRIRRTKSLSGLEIENQNTGNNKLQISVHNELELVNSRDISAFIDEYVDEVISRQSELDKISASNDSNQQNSIMNSGSITVKPSAKSAPSRDFALNTISPLSSGGLSPILEGEFRFEDPDAIPTRTQNAKPRKNRLLFVELNTGMRTLDGSMNEDTNDQPKDQSEGQGNEDTNDQDKDQPEIQENEATAESNKKKSEPKAYYEEGIYGWRRMVAIIMGLAVFILILLAAFIPTIVYFSNGTKQTTSKYLNRNQDELSQMYSDRYGEPNAVETNSNSSFELKLVEEYHNKAPIIDMELHKTRKLTSIAKKMYGVAYSPLQSMEPDCGVTARAVELDLVKLSVITNRIRTYGVQCDQAELILRTIDKLKLDVTVSLGIWIGSNDHINNEQLNTAKRLLTQYPDYMFDSVLVGNEVLFRHDKSEDELIKYIKSTRRYLQTLNSRIPVGTAEIGSLISANLLANCDVIGANIHPFFGGGKVEYASNWVFDFVKYQLEPMNYYNTPIVITEVGWPIQGGKFLSSVANVKNFEYFMNDFLCKVSHTKYGYYYFEAYDEPWKSIYHEPNRRWETEWGIFNSDRSNKIDLSEVGSCDI